MNDGRQEHPPLKNYAHDTIYLKVAELLKHAPHLNQ